MELLFGCLSRLNEHYNYAKFRLTTYVVFSWKLTQKKKLKKRKTYDASLAKALFKRRTFHVPNLKLLLST